jgi:phosphoglycolate phosphatase-like HAD superfamily hydrolase
MRTVILDIDGTLVDSNDAHAHAWVAAFAESRITVDYDKVRRLIGMGGDKLMPAVAGIESDSPAGEKISTRRGQIFKDTYLPALRPFPSVRLLMERFIKDGYSLAVASSAKENELQPLLACAGIDDLIPHRTSSDDAENSKPEPDIVEAALEKCGCQPQNATMLGDTPYDIEAATGAGVRIVAFESGGWSRDELAGAIAVYKDATDLLAHYDASPFAARA